MTEKMKKAAADQPLGFEKALERLEKIVADMENGSLSLDQMMDRFSEGSQLVKFCNDKLNEVERKIELLVSKDGQVTTQPFDEKPDELAF